MWRALRLYVSIGLHRAELDGIRTQKVHKLPLLQSGTYQASQVRGKAPPGGGTKPRDTLLF
jgi:hypothetical protein